MATSDPQRWQLVKRLFDACVDGPAAEREAIIARARPDATTLAELRTLLRHHDASSSATQPFLEAPAVAAEPEARLQPGQRLGAWAVVRALGAGGMGEVFEVRRADGQYEGRAAVKLLRRGMDSAAVLQRFALERQALARLNHPHIARLLDAGASDDGQPYVVMEYVQGRPIDQAARGLPVPQRLALFVQLGEAVAHAHRNLLVHRDLKPGNVLVDDEGSVKLLDFGIAKALDPLEGAGAGAADATVAGPRPFTPSHASPEQVRGEPVTTATDVYSLGVLLYQLLTGVRPTGRGAGTPAEVARSVIDEQPTRPSRLAVHEALDPQWALTRKALEGDLDNIVLKALEKAPEHRYRSVEALVADVVAHLEGRPVAARPASPGYVLGKFVRRNRWAVLAGGLGGLGLASGLAAALMQGREAAALGVVGLAGGLGLALLQARRAGQARDDAQRQLAGVKNIATELVFRYGDAIQHLPGGAKAQEAMLRQTVDSLDLTLRQSPTDVDLTVLVASALGRLAQIQGNPTFAGPERAAEAQATVSRALALADRVWDTKRGEARFVTQHLVTLLTQANMLRNAGQPQAGLAVLETAARRSAETLAERLPDGERAAVMELRANVLTNMAHFNEHPGRPSLGRPEQALRHWDEAEQAFRQIYGDEALVAALEAENEPGSPAVAEWADHNIANTLIGRALVHQRLQDHEAMARGAAAALALRRANVARNPGSAVWRQSLMFDCGYLALALLRLGRADEALPVALEAWQLIAERLRDDGETPLWLATRGNLAPQVAQALAAAGRHGEAQPVWELALQRATQMRRDADTPATRQRLAWLQAQQAATWVALGRGDEARASAAAVQAALRQEPEPLLHDGAAAAALAATLQATASA